MPKQTWSNVVWYPFVSADRCGRPDSSLCAPSTLRKARAHVLGEWNGVMVSRWSVNRRWLCGRAYFDPSLCCDFCVCHWWNRNTFTLTSNVSLFPQSPFLGKHFSVDDHTLEMVSSLVCPVGTLFAFVIIHCVLSVHCDLVFLGRQRHSWSFSITVTFISLVPLFLSNMACSTHSVFQQLAHIFSTHHSCMWIQKSKSMSTQKGKMTNSDGIGAGDFRMIIGSWPKPS